MKSRLVTFLFLLSSLSFQVSAMGPSEKIAEAINQPVSYFRFGLLQLEQHIQGDVAAALGLRPGKNGAIADVLYRFDDNRIDVMLLNFSRHNVTKEAAAQFCASKLTELRRQAGVNEQGELNRRNYSLFASVMASFMGFEKSWEADMMKEYDRIMFLTVTVRWDVSGYPLKCYGPLVSKTIWASTDDSKTKPWLVQ